MGTIKILLVDDDHDLLAIMKLILAKEGYIVDICPNAEGIYSILANQPPDYIFMDLHMNGINGDELCRVIKTQEKVKEIPLILLSSDVEVGKIADDCGADGYLPKPLDAEGLQKAIRMLQNLS